MSEGQVSETSMMTPEGGADSIPGTGEGIPQADESQQVPQGRPRDYSDDPDGRSGLKGTDDELGGAV